MACTDLRMTLVRDLVPLVADAELVRSAGNHAGHSAFAERKPCRWMMFLPLQMSDFLIFFVVGEGFHGNCRERYWDETSKVRVVWLETFHGVQTRHNQP